MSYSSIVWIESKVKGSGNHHPRQHISPATAKCVSKFRQRLAICKVEAFYALEGSTKRGGKRAKESRFPQGGEDVKTQEDA